MGGSARGGDRCIDRHWPPALKDSGAWPLTSLCQSFLIGALTRLIDLDTILRRKIVELVARASVVTTLAPAVAELSPAADVAVFDIVLARLA